MARAALLTCSGPWDLPTIQGGSEGVRWDQSCQGPPQPLLRRMRRCGLPVSRDFHVVGIKCIKLQRDVHTCRGEEEASCKLRRSYCGFEVLRSPRMPSPEGGRLSAAHLLLEELL